MGRQASRRAASEFSSAIGHSETVDTREPLDTREPRPPPAVAGVSLSFSGPGLSARNSPVRRPDLRGRAKKEGTGPATEAAEMRNGVGERKKPGTEGARRGGGNGEMRGN